MNKINLENVNVLYQLTSRFSLEASLPILFASRRSHNSYSTTTSSGIGDSSFLAQGWILDPKKSHHSYNASIGIGLSMPTGKDNVKNNIVSSPTATPTVTTVDYSIQPGQGAWGMVFQWQAFKNLGKSVIYTDGSYLATQGGYNNVLRSATALNQPLTAYNAIQDQYLLEAGVSHPISKVKGLTLTGPRWEGVPARDMIGNDLGFRRPGYAVSLMPGIIYVRGTSMLTASVGKALLRDRTRSIPDRILGSHGDAAFADYVWFVNYTYRIPKKAGKENQESLFEQAKACSTMCFSLFDCFHFDLR